MREGALPLRKLPVKISGASELWDAPVYYVPNGKLLTSVP